MNTINVRETDPSTHDAPLQKRQRDRWIPPLISLLLLLIVLVSLLFWLPLDQTGGAGTSEQNENGASAGDGNGRGPSPLGGAGTGQAGNDSGSANHGDASASANAGDSTGATPTPQAAEQTAGAYSSALEASPASALSEQTHAPAPNHHRTPSDQAALPELGFSSNLTAPPPPEVAPENPITPVPAASAMGAGPAGNAGLASFFGQAGHGSRFVFVIDRSGSMSGAAFEAAQFELIRSLRSLRPHESFYIIFYDNDAMPMPANGLVRATPANIERFVEWLRQVGTGGGTNPTEAMVTALSRLKPDTIWLLSDGAFNVGVAETITRHNPQRRIHINTIAFKNRSGEAILKIIADENKGDYRFVDPP